MNLDSSRRWLSPRVAIPAVALVLATGGALAQQQTTVACTFDVKPDTTDTSTTINITGDADLADGYVLTVQLVAKGVAVATQDAPVEKKKFAARFGPWKKILLPGHYDVTVALLPAAQKSAFKAAVTTFKLTKDKVPLEVGTPQEQAARADSVKKKIIDVLEGLRLAYLELNQSGSYYRAELQMLNLNSRITDLPPAKLDENKKKYRDRQVQLLPAWQESAQANMEERFKTARYDWKIFREQIVASPFPDAELKVDELFKAVEFWFHGMNASISALCGQPLPEDASKAAPPDPLKLDPEIVQLAQSCYTALGYPSMPQWKISDLSEPETGEIKEEWYRSYVSKFMVRKPDNWGFYPGGVRPSARLRFTPPEQTDPRKRTETIICVEILDFAMAQDNKHLAQLARELNRNRWRAKEVKTENINAPDVTMPHGTRPGIESEFLIEQGGIKVRMRYYQLFCRWHKRTYGVLSIARDENWSGLEETFRKTNSSFRVLDAPEFHDKAEKERRDAIAKEGRNPDDAFRKAHEFSHPYDSKDAKKPDPGASPDPNKKPEGAPK